MKKFFARFWVFIPLILAVAMWFLLPLSPAFTEYVVSRGLGKGVITVLGFIISLIPISLTEWVVLLVIPAIITLIVVFIVRLRRSGVKSRTLLKAGKFTVGTVGIIAFLYMTCHGANYYRFTLAENMNLNTSNHSQEELRDVCIMLADGAAQARSELFISDDAEYVFADSVYTELSRAGSGYKAIMNDYPWLWTSVWRQKPVLLSEPWSYTFITGMYFPMLSECNVNIAVPDYEIPFTAAHESAHSRGIAFENECNFLAFLSCINSEYPEYRYSGYMEALNYCLSDLNSEYSAAVSEHITKGMLADYAASDAFWDAHRDKEVAGVPVHEVSTTVNDTFIKSQGVESGVESYGEVTELILGYYF